MRLIEVEVELANSANVARTGGTHDWDVVANPDNSESADGSYQSIVAPAPVPGFDIKMNYLKRQGLTTPSALLAYPLYAVKVKLVANAGGPTTSEDPPADTVCYTDSVCLVKGGSILTSVDKGTEAAGTEWTGVETRYYTFTQADLATLGITRVGDLFGDPNDFGAAVGLSSDDSIPAAPTGHYAQVDQLALVLVLLVQEEDMDHYRAGLGGGFEVLLAEEMPSVAISAAIFANVPEGCTLIEFTPRVADVVIRWNPPGEGGVATTANGNTYVAGVTHLLHGNYSTFLAARAIESGGTATGWITYKKVA